MICLALKYDVITGESIGTPLVYEYGEYEWDSIDIHYFEKHNIELRPDFIEHALKKMEERNAWVRESIKAKYYKMYTIY